MNYKKFDQGDILRNTIKTYPKNSIFIDNTGSVYLKNLNQILSSDNKNSNLVAYTSLNLNESYSSYRRFYELNSKHSFYKPANSENTSEYVNAIINRYGFLSSSINIFYITSSNSPNFTDTQSLTGINQVKKIVSLKNTLDWNMFLSPFYDSKYFLESYKSYPNDVVSAKIKDTSIVNLPAVFYGSEIKKGSVRLDFYITGTLIGTLEDIRQNGELIETTGSNVGSMAGVILYSEGIFLITGSWNLNQSSKDNYCYFTGSNNTKSIVTEYPKWIHWGKSILSSSLLNSSSFELNFQGTNYIPTMTLFAHAHKNEFNMTNNKTSIDHTQGDFDFFTSGSNSYLENQNILYKNITKTPYTTESGSFKKESFITKVALYDKNKKLLGIAKLATPVKKNNEREYTFKLKLDI